MEPAGLEAAEPVGGSSGRVSSVTGDDVGGSDNLKSKSLFFTNTVLLMYKDDPVPRIFKSRLLSD